MDLLNFFHKNSIIKISKISLVVLATPIFFSACSGKYEELPELKKDANEPFMHKVESQKLKNVMHELNHLVFERFYSEIDRDKMRVRYSNEIASIVSSITSDVKKIETLENELNLNENQKIIFMRYVRELRESGEELKAIANSAQTESIKPVLNKMVNSCNSCHEQFRKIN